jgi:N-acetyl-gamma-glutamyl-phosphate reductase
MNNYSQRRKAGIVGVSGYSGRELLRLLERHGGIEPLVIPRERETEEIAGMVKEHRLDVVFLATPHEVSMEVAPVAIRAGAKVVDLSGAFRLKDAAVFERAYKMPHTAPDQLKWAVYGMPELDRSGIPGAFLVANPGCYPTSVILALMPMLRAGLADTSAGIICDCKSGVSGAGHKPSEKTHFCAVQENFSAYGILEHRHVPEMIQALGVPPEDFCFTAHLLPVERGILSTIYVRLSRPQEPEATLEAIRELYRKTYPAGGFVRVRDEAPNLHDVRHSNYCDVYVTLSADGRRAVLVSAIDNLVKGAAGQAVQNMNLMLGFPEGQGLL